MRGIVALILLLVSTAAMAEPQRQTFKEPTVAPGSVGDRQPWQHHVSMTRWVGQADALHRHQGQHDVLHLFGRNAGRSTTNGTPNHV